MFVEVSRDFAEGRSQESATEFLIWTQRMPTFSGPLTLPKRVSISSSPFAELAIEDDDGFRAVIAGVNGFGRSVGRAA